MPKKSAKKSENKSSQKKTSSAKTKKKTSPDSRKKELRKELQSLVKLLNEEQLESLVGQAQILVHNARVVEEYRENRKRAEEYTKGTGKTAKRQKVRIEESDDDTYFVIVANNYRNFIELSEMKKIVALCQGASTREEGAMRLYSWFRRERIDILNNTSIANENDPALKELYDAIIKTYTVKR